MLSRKQLYYNSLKEWKTGGNNLLKLQLREKCTISLKKKITTKLEFPKETSLLWRWNSQWVKSLKIIIQNHPSTHQRNWVSIIKITINILALVLNCVLANKIMANFEVNSLKMSTSFFLFYFQFGFLWRQWSENTLIDYLRMWA